MRAIQVSKLIATGAVRAALAEARNEQSGSGLHRLLSEICDVQLISSRLTRRTGSSGRVYPTR
jgi:hypothetical protein